MLKLFNEIALLGSPEDKIQKLLSYPYQEELKTVLRLATDPFITFGITSVEGLPQGRGNPYDILKKCSLRELSGQRAREALGLSASDGSEQEVLVRIIRKDLRCGVGTKLVLRAYPKLIREFSVMRADKFKGLPSRGKYIIQPKYDGLRCIAVVESGVVRLLSRNGLEFTSSDHLKDPILQLVDGKGDCVLDGELVSGNFNESSSAVRKKGTQNDSTSYHIFEFMELAEWNNPIQEYHMRRRSLENLFQRPVDGRLKLVPEYRVESEDEVFRRYGEFLDLGYEGGMVKKLSGKYRFKRHSDWMKLKEVNDVDLRVESLVQGEGKYHGMLGAAIVKYNGKRVSVGSGFSDSERELFWSDPTLIMGKVIEIQYHQVTPDGSLRHPRFVMIREDKS